MSAPGKLIELSEAVTVRRLAELLTTSPIEVIKQLMRKGVMANINQTLDFDIAAAVASDFGYEVKKPPKPGPKAPSRDHLWDEEDDPAKLKPRPPVVTILGHVDHGKTTLLDAIRHTRVAEREVGGITQHIGAYQVEYKGQKITFLDTPGHEAFTSLRARGAQVADIAVLVVAADDGIMPQTVEAIDHAKAAGVPIVVAINKIDKPEADPEKVKRQLSEHGLLIEEWGGTVIAVPISAKEKIGLDELLENILVVAEVSELKANPDRPAVGVVIESRLDKSRGPVATVLVQKGVLRVGDRVVAGETWGRIKAMITDTGKRVKEAYPSTPVEVLGISETPRAGDLLAVVPDEKTAKEIVAQRRRQREQETRGPTLERLMAQIQAGEVQELNIIVKADTQGSVEAIRSALERLSDRQVRVRILHASTGTITESDVLLAIASKGIVIGFNSRPEPGAKRLAEAEGVDIRYYDIIYRLIEDIQKALLGMLEPTYEEQVIGRAEVKAVFPLGKRGKVAGVLVKEGRISRNASVRLLRKGQTIYEGTISSLKHYKEDVREMAAGFECGVGLEGFFDFQEGDILEAYRKEKVSP